MKHSHPFVGRFLLPLDGVPVNEAFNVRGDNYNEPSFRSGSMINENNAKRAGLRACYFAK